MLKLIAAQAAYYLVVSVDLTLIGLVGLQLAPNLALVTLPLTLIVAVGTVCSFLAGSAASRFGYRPVMLAGAITAIVGGLISAAGVVYQSFLLFCLGAALTGGYRAVGGFLRYIGAEHAPEAKREKALAWVMYGGIIAAAIGPFAAVFASKLTPTPYLGSCLLVSIVGLVALILAALMPKTVKTDSAGSGQSIRVRDRLGNRAFLQSLLVLAISGLVMTLVMAAGPLANHHAGHSADNGALMIQWHLVGMFAPSVLSAMLMRKIGAVAACLVGIGVMGIGLVVALFSGSEWAMISTLALVGVGWNVMFVGGSALLLGTYGKSAAGNSGARLQGFTEGTTAVLSALGSFAAASVLQQLGWAGTNVVALICLGLLAAAILGLMAMRATPIGLAKAEAIAVSGEELAAN